MPNTLTSWLQNSALGGYLAHLEQQFYQQALHDVYMPTAIQLAQPQWKILQDKEIIYINQDIFMQPEALAIASDSVNILLMPHLLETCEQPQQVLQEAYRVLAHEGKVVLTGFNPFSLWRFSKQLAGKHLPPLANWHALPALKDNIRQIGFSIHAGQFMAYIPPVQTASAIQKWQWMEKAGNRWWPHAAAVYGLVLQKHIIGVHPLKPQAWTDLLLQPAITPAQKQQAK